MDDWIVLTNLGWQEQPPVSVPEQERTDVPAHRHPLYNPKQADMVEKRLAVLTRMYEEGRITNSRKVRRISHLYIS